MKVLYLYFFTAGISFFNILYTMQLRYIYMPCRVQLHMYIETSVFLFDIKYVEPLQIGYIQDLYQ